MSIEPTLSRPAAPELEVTEKTFATSKLPWLVAVAAIVVYGLTLNRFVTFGSLGIVAKVSGWTWRPETANPVYWLVTLPFQWLPQKWIPLGLNLLSLGCATWTLALLARSVALLPHDRTEAQRIREKSTYSLLSIRTAWLPPVFAVLVCGLQLTFWEHATVASEAIFNLLLFAYVIRALLEFRIDGRHSWLYRASLIYGAAMANNWAMVGFFPLFIVALVWSKGFSFFDARFITRMLLLGLAGLCFYLLLPLVQSIWGATKASFWEVLKANLTMQKLYLTHLPFSKDALWQNTLWVLALPSLVPVLVMAIRWPSYFGDPSKLGVTLTTLIFHVFHGAMLGICLWVTLDPEKLSPRHMLGLPLLGLYYLGALSVGYYAGYFLLVFGTRPASRLRRVPPYFGVLSLTAKGLVWLLLLAAPALLVYRNLPQIKLANGPMLQKYASLLAGTLPSNGVVVLSDDPGKTFLVQAALAGSPRASSCMFLDTDALNYPDYYRFLKRRNPKQELREPTKDRFLTPPPNAPKNQKFPDRVETEFVVETVRKLAEAYPLYYLHPSFGYYFEWFYLEPQGLAYRMVRYRPTAVEPPPIGKELINDNERFWDDFDRSLLSLIADAVRPTKTGKPASVWEKLMDRLHLKPEVNVEALQLGSYCSRALNYWGVALQRAGKHEFAAKRFAHALELNPANSAVRVNLDCNTALQQNRKLKSTSEGLTEDRIGARTWDYGLNINGPYDDPVLCYEQGLYYRQSSLRYLLTRRDDRERPAGLRQAVQEFRRAEALVPEWLEPRLRQAELFVLARMPDISLKKIRSIREVPEFQRPDLTNLIQVVNIEVSAYLQNTNTDAAETAVESALKAYPKDEGLLDYATQFYMNARRYSNALVNIERSLLLQPNSPDLLCNKGFAYLQMTNYAQAIPPLSQVIQMWADPASPLRAIEDTNAAALLYHRTLLNRAIAYLQLNKLEDARDDYKTLDRIYTNSFRILYGLGEVAYRKNDTNEAIRSYELYLAHGASNSVEYNFVSNRLTVLRSGR